MDEEKTDHTEEDKEENHYLAKFIKKQICEEEIINASVKNTTTINISPSTLGRLTLMLEESINTKDKGEKIWNEFKKRIDSIKREREKSEIKAYLKNTICCNNEIILDKEKLNLPKGCEKEDKQTFINENWYKLLKKNLTVLKYNKKISESDNAGEEETGDGANN